jgi:hypothetical protein
MTGRWIREERLESRDQQVDVSGLQEGLFFIKLNRKGNNRTSSFIRR